MIQGLTDDYAALTNTTAVSRTQAVSPEQEEKETGKKVQAQAPRIDTVEISDQAKAAARLHITASEKGERQPDGGETPQSGMPPPDGAARPASSDSADSSQDTPVLTTLTETELKELVSSGTITRSQMQSELSRREAQKQAAQDGQEGPPAYASAAAAAEIQE